MAALAFPNLSEVVTTTLRSRTGQLADNMSRNNAGLIRMNKRGNIKPFDGGRTIVQELNYNNNLTFQWYAGYQTLAIQPSQVFTSAEFPIRQAAVAVSISGFEEIQNSGEEAIIDLLENRVSNAEDTFMNGLSNGFYGDGSIANSIGGLQLLISTSPTTGTVGGINRATWTFWQNQKWSAASNGSTTLSPGTIQSQMDSLWLQLVRGRDSADLLLFDNTMYRYFLQSLQAIQRVNEVSPDFAGLGYQTLKFITADVVLDGGFQGFSNDPLPFETTTSTSAVGGVPSTTGFFLNTKYIHWRPSSRRNMVPLDPDRFSINQDAMVRILGWAGNATLSNSFLQGVLVA
jgi:hypothetical protein